MSFSFSPLFCHTRTELRSSNEPFVCYMNRESNSEPWNRPLSFLLQKRNCWSFQIRIMFVCTVSLSCYNDDFSISQNEMITSFLHRYAFSMYFMQNDLLFSLITFNRTEVENTIAFACCLIQWNNRKKLKTILFMQNIYIYFLLSYNNAIYITHLSSILKY